MQKTIDEKDKENDRLEGRIAELEVRIGKLNTEKYEIVQEFQGKEDEIKALMQVIKNHEFNFKQLENDIDTLKDGIKERDEAMQTMTKTLVEKGETNRRLSETVNTIKNQLLIDKVFDQKFIVQQAGNFKMLDYTFKFIRDRSEAGEFFLEISSASTS